MSFPPGWDSINSTETFAHYLHVTAVIVLGLLFVAEGMALLYDFRNHRLVKIAEGVRESVQQAKEDAAEARRKTEVAEWQNKLADADKKLSDIQQQQADRHLTDAQKRDILAAIAPFPGQEAEIFAVMNDGEGIAYANEFFELFRVAKWKINGVSQAVYTADIRGINGLINTDWALKNQAPLGIAALLNVLTDMHLLTQAAGDKAVGVNAIRLIIGRKPGNK